MMRNLFLLVAFFTMTIANAQFSSSETVYIYKYDHTETDGIKSKGKENYYWIIFQDDMIGQASESSLSKIRQNLLENPSYYEDKAGNNLASSLKSYRNGPDLFVHRLVDLWKYCDELSTGSKKTYRCKTAHAIDNLSTATSTWGELKWDVYCRSFSNDRSELIVWRTNDSGNRDYYKRISVSDLKPNTDFLY